MFGATCSKVLNEKTPFNPVSPYGVSKVSAYYICKYYREAFGLKIVTAISFNHEGPFRHELFVTRKLSIAAAKGHFPVNFGNLNAIRDWGHVLDFCKAFHLMVKNPKEFCYVVATGKIATVREFAKEVFEQAGYKNLKWQGEGLHEKLFSESKLLL